MDKRLSDKREKEKNVPPGIDINDFVGEDLVDQCRRLTSFVDSISCLY